MTTLFAALVGSPIAEELDPNPARWTQSQTAIALHGVLRYLDAKEQEASPAALPGGKIRELRMERAWYWQERDSIPFESPPRDGAPSSRPDQSVPVLLNSPVAATGDYLPEPQVGRPSGPDEVSTQRCGCDESKALREQVFALQDRLAECDEDDSRWLQQMREVIDDKIGWQDEAQEESGDYLGRLRQVADQLPGLQRAERQHAAAEKVIACLIAISPDLLPAAAGDAIAEAVNEYNATRGPL